MTKMKNNKKNQSVILIGIVLFAVLFSIIVPRVFEWNLMSDVRQAAKRNEQYVQKRAESYPNIAKKLELYKNNEIELSDKEAETLVSIRLGLIENPREWLLGNFERLLSSDNPQMQSFLQENPQHGKQIEAWVDGQIQPSTETVEELMDCYYGYVDK